MKESYDKTLLYETIIIKTRQTKVSDILFNKIWLPSLFVICIKSKLRFLFHSSKHNPCKKFKIHVMLSIWPIWPMSSQHSQMKILDWARLLKKSRYHTARRSAYLREQLFFFVAKIWNFSHQLRMLPPAHLCQLLAQKIEIKNLQKKIE